MSAGLVLKKVDSMSRSNVAVEAVGTHWYLYLIKCRNGSLYTGITTDVQRRFEEHNSSGPKAAKYLRGKGPLELVFSAQVGDRGQASILEYRVKKLSKAVKQDMIMGKTSLWAATDVERLACE